MTTVCHIYRNYQNDKEEGIMKRSKKLCYRIVLSIIVVLFAVCYAQAANLWKGEEVRSGAGYPAIIKFVKGDLGKSLVVFIPGAHHMARIAYGDDNRRKEDFLAHWLGKEGYNFLAISYPVDTPSKAFDGVYPEFTTQAWGKQAAEITKQIVNENGLKGNVIVCGWSMGGKVAQPFNAAAKEIDLELDFYAALAATPPTFGNIVMGKKVAMFPNGLADRSKDIPKWYKQVAKNAEYNQGRAIIPWEIYQAEYTGAISIQQQAYGLRYKEGSNAFVRDYWAEIQDTKPYDWANFPLVAVIQPDKREDVRHSLTDKAAWSFYISNKIFTDYTKRVDVKKLSEEKWRSLLDLTQMAPERLSIEVSGNHFFFVGESGARETATAIAKMEQKVHALKSELGSILGVAIQ
jgi:thioesterase domain-containing protein